MKGRMKRNPIYTKRNTQLLNKYGKKTMQKQIKYEEKNLLLLNLFVKQK